MSGECLQNDPHCGMLYGDKCERGCFEVTVETNQFQRLINIEKCALYLINNANNHNTKVAMNRLIYACEAEE